ncbi:MAG: hypothetical protein AAF726_15645 [Planctomycetota bacterium]
MREPEGTDVGSGGTMAYRTKWGRLDSSRRERQTGTALFAVIPIAILMMSVMVAFVGTTVDTSRANVSELDTFRARAAAQSVASLAIADLWSDFEALSTGSQQMWAFRAHLDGIDLPDQAGVNKPAKTSFLTTLSLATDLYDRPSMDGAEIERVDVHRLDNWDSTSIVIEVDAVIRKGVDGSASERRSSIQETFTVSPPEWDGLDYVLLANNVNCLLCHTSIDNVNRYYNRDTSLAGTFEPVQVGSIDSMHFREDPDSQVAGVLLIGGDAIMGDGDDINDWSKFNLTAAQNLNGFLVEDTFGNLDYDDLLVYDPDATSPDPHSTLYLDFYDYAGQTDFALPNRFPAPFPDDGGLDQSTLTPMPENAGNRVIDDSEFYTTVAGVKGSMSGGTISVLDKTKRIETNADRSAMMSGNATGIAGVTDGNVYLHGTVDNPILLDGDVAVDGDVIISGYVKGQGTLRARGNVYVTSDLVYDDAGGPMGAMRNYGFASDGVENNLAIASGGNIVVGDFYRPAWGEGGATNGTKASSFNFTMEELAIFNRMEWIKTQPTLPGKSEKVQTGTRTIWYDEKVKETYKKNVTKWKWVKTGKKIKKPKYKTIWVSNGLPGEYEVKKKKKVQDGFKYIDEKIKVKNGTKTVTKTRWVKTGKKLSREEPVMTWVTPQVSNPYFDAYHTPRYYSFSDGSTVPIFNKSGHFDPKSGHWKSDERAGGWDDKKLSYANPNDKSDPYFFNPDGSPAAVLSTVSPTADWISGDMMRQVIEDGLADQANGSKTFEVDATLYSANSILGTVPDRNSPNTNGRLLVNGQIVAADVGILAPVGMDVNFDERGGLALSITADDGLTISRRFSAPAIGYD